MDSIETKQMIASFTAICLRVVLWGMEGHMIGRIFLARALAEIGGPD